MQDYYINEVKAKVMAGEFYSKALENGKADWFINLHLFSEVGTQCVHNSLKEIFEELEIIKNGGLFVPGPDFLLLWHYFTQFNLTLLQLQLVRHYGVEELESLTYKLNPYAFFNLA